MCARIDTEPNYSNVRHSLSARPQKISFQQRAKSRRLHLDKYIIVHQSNRGEEKVIPTRNAPMANPLIASEVTCSGGSTEALSLDGGGIMGVRN